LVLCSQCNALTGDYSLLCCVAEKEQARTPSEKLGWVGSSLMPLALERADAQALPASFVVYACAVSASHMLWTCSSVLYQHYCADCRWVQQLGSLWWCSEWRRSEVASKILVGWFAFGRAVPCLKVLFFGTQMLPDISSCALNWKQSVFSVDRKTRRFYRVQPHPPPSSSPYRSPWWSAPPPAKFDRVRRLTKVRFQNRYSEEFEVAVRRTRKEEWQVSSRQNLSAWIRTDIFLQCSQMAVHGLNRVCRCEREPRSIEM